MLLSGCGIFGNDKDKDLEPLKLEKIETTFDVRKLWSTKVGGGTELLRVGLNPAGDGNRIYAASYDGKVSAFGADKGDRVWRADLDVRISAGPGVGGGLAVVAGYDGDLVALRAEDGSEVWRTNIEAECLSKPQVAKNTVIVATIDGRLRAFSALDGTQLWSVEQSVPALTQRGNASPIIVGNSVVSGFDNGRLVSVGLTDGVVEWETVLSPPSGRSDLDRLADVDGNLASVGQDLYAAGYNGRIASVAAESGQILWARDLSSPVGVAADWNNLYTVGNDGEVVAILRRNGDDVWRQESLLRREPTIPVPFNTTVVVGDFEGYVHFFSNFDGHAVARVRVGKGMISGPPVVVGDKLFVQSETGVLVAFKVRPPKRPKTAPGDADKADTKS